MTEPSALDTILDRETSGLKSKQRQYSARSIPDYSAYLIIQIQQEIALAIDDLWGPTNSVPISVEIPPDSQWGNLCVSGFIIGKQIGKNPIQVADDLATVLSQNPGQWISGATAVRGYINFFLKPEIAREAIRQITALDTQFGHHNLHRGQTTIIDYSAPNIAKPIGVGHLRSTIIGHALANIQDAAGYCALRLNYLGDWGTQFGTLLAAFQREAEPPALSIENLKSLYVNYTQESKDTPELVNVARAEFAKLEQMNPAAIGLWKAMRDVSISGFQQIYNRLGIQFDSFSGESFFAHRTPAMVARLLDQKLAVSDPESGAIVVSELDRLPSFLVQKQDGTSLYLARDLTALAYRIENFSPAAVLYVVGNEQELHFRQLFALANRMWGTKTQLHHIGFGLLLNSGKKMSTRSGTTINLETVLDEAVSRSRTILENRQIVVPQLDISAVSEIVGISAILYNDLRRLRTKNIEFNWETMLSFESSSSVYLQYSYARIQSLIRKAHATGISDAVPDTVPDLMSIEREMVMLLIQFPQLVTRVATNHMPHEIASYIERLAQLFNQYYAAVPIITASDRCHQSFRLSLVKSVGIVIRNALSLLSIATLDYM